MNHAGNGTSLRLTMKTYSELSQREVRYSVRPGANTNEWVQKEWARERSPFFVFVRVEGRFCTCPTQAPLMLCLMPVCAFGLSFASVLKASCCVSNQLCALTRQHHE